MYNFNSQNKDYVSYKIYKSYLSLPIFETQTALPRIVHRIQLCDHFPKEWNDLLVTNRGNLALVEFAKTQLNIEETEECIEGPQN